MQMMRPNSQRMSRNTRGFQTILLCNTQLCHYKGRLFAMDNANRTKSADRRNSSFMKPLNFHQNNQCIVIQNFIPFEMKPIETADNK
jgi:hypothetical protein